MVLSDSLASALGRPDLALLTSGQNTATSTLPMPVGVGSSLGGDGLLGGRISTGLLALMVAGLAGFYLWTRGVQV